jgi:hypothetical protein
MRSIEQLDLNVSEALSEFDKLTEQINFGPTHALTDETDLEGLAYPGVYKIDIRTTDLHADLPSWISWFEPLWHAPDYKLRFVPNIRKGRVRMHTELLQWMPLYVGKSRCVSKRVREHLSLPIDKNTFALKLSARQNLVGQEFQVSAIKLSVNNYDVFAPRLENIMRNRFNPIVGKQ